MNNTVDHEAVSGFKGSYLSALNVVDNGGYDSDGIIHLKKREHAIAGDAELEGLAFSQRLNEERGED
jgi:hypothetical protein